MYISELENIRRTAESALARALSDPKLHSFVDTFQHIIDEYERVKIQLSGGNMKNITQYYVVSVKHTQEEDPYITMWNPNNAGYCFRTEVAGKYSHADVMDHINYYNGGEDSLAVDCNTINDMSEQVEKGYLDESGMVLKNSEQNWKTIMYNTIAEPERLPRPQPNSR